MTLRILLVHNRYIEAGGEDVAVAAEAEMLRRNGHFVEEYIEDNHRIQGLNRFRLALRAIWSIETYRKVRSLLKASRYDLVFVHNDFPLVSPSIYYAAKSMQVPVIHTLHNFRLMCVNGLLLRDNHVCEDCVGRRLAWPGIRHACYRGSHMASAVVALVTAIHRLIGTWSSKVDIYITLTEFGRQKHMAGGLPAERIVVKPNFLTRDPGEGNGSGGYALFVGRLSPEKGVGTLIEAWKLLGTGAPPLKILGDGPLAAELRGLAGNQVAIEWLGQREQLEVIRRMQAARIVVLTSRCYENFPRVIAEAFGCGVPVLAPRLGAMATLIRDGETGLFFEHDSAASLAAKISWVWAHPNECADMGRAARREFLQRYTADENHKQFESICAAVHVGQ